MISIPQPDGGPLASTFLPLILVGVVVAAFSLSLWAALDYEKSPKAKISLAVSLATSVLLVVLGIVGLVQANASKAVTREAINSAYGIRLTDESAHALMHSGQVPLSTTKKIYFTYEGALYINTVVAYEGDGPGTFRLGAFDGSSKIEPFENRITAGGAATPLEEEKGD